MKLADALGLFLYVTPQGFKSWRMKYRFSGKEKQLTFGGYPEVSLLEARERRDEARKLLRDNLDPGVVRKQRAAEQRLRGANSLQAAVERWHAAQKPHWAPRYAGQVLDRFRNDVFPALGALPITDVTVPLVIDTLRKVERRGAIETAHRLRQHLSDVFQMAIASGDAATNPAAGITKAMKRYTTGRRPAVRTVAEARELLAAIEAAEASTSTKLASRLLALTAARPAMVRMAVPAEFEDLDGPGPIWRIPAAKMKLIAERKRDVSFEFVIPLAPAAVATVKAALGSFAGTVMFPGIRNGATPISDNTLGKLYREAGYRGRHVPHGWRATFSTIMNEIAAIENRVGDRDIIDLMLAHLPADVESTYNRYAYLPRRRELAVEWAGLLMAGARPAQDLVAA